MIFLFNKVTEMEDENVIEMMHVSSIKVVFTISQDFIVDLMGKWGLNNWRVKWIHN